MKKKLDQWTSKFEQKLLAWKSAIDSNLEAKTISGGFKIWYSPVMENAEIMIYGINPGQNEGKNNETFILNPSDVFEYVAHNPNYTLANQTKEIFKLSNLYNVFEKQTIKTNFYPIITKNQSSIKYCLNKTGKNNFKNFEIELKAMQLELIDLINPKIILCEGKSTFYLIASLFQQNDKINWNNNCGNLVVNDNKLVIIGYSRLFSNIKNKQGVAALLTKFYK